MVASHSHPEVSKGGAENAAFQLFKGLLGRDDCEAWFLGYDRTAQVSRPGALISQPYSDREYIYGGTAFDWFKFANTDPRFPGTMERLVADLAPHIVHFHHYVNFGVEVFQHVKRAAPHCKIVLTLHEYLAICNHLGQMVTTRHHSLCNRASAARCQQCFPELDKADFFLRYQYISRFFGLVDAFIAPSHFLAERYVAWGLPAEKITVIENVAARGDGNATRGGWPALPLRLGFFGQISKLKGIDVILDAAQQLLDEGGVEVTFDIFGEYRGQPPEFQQAFVQRLDKIGRNVCFHGPYDGTELDALMQSVHAVLVPSVWWENSPLVIQEALRNRRPVICSNIGGMAEKVRDGIDGYHFPVGSVGGLATLVRRLVAEPEALARLAETMSPGVPAAGTISTHIALYRKYL